MALLVLAGVQAQPLLMPQLYLPLASVPGPTWTPEPPASATASIPPTSTATASATTTSTATASIPPTSTATTGATTTSTATASATTTSTATASATPTVSPTNAPATARVSGSVRLRPVAVAYEHTAPKPQRYVIILDVSGSQNMNLLGQGWRKGRVTQCAPGSPDAPPSQDCGQPFHAWPAVEERRIYVQKQAALRLIGGLNMPGNAGYDAERPLDQVLILAYTHQLIRSGPLDFSDALASDPFVLTEAVLQAGRAQADPYLAEGSTNWALGLYAATQLIDAVAPTVEFGGTRYSYDERVIFVTDGPSKLFFRPTSPTISAGQSSMNTYPAGSYCRSLGAAVVENAACQTTEVGGTYNGMDRPITQAVRISRELLQALPERSVRVFTVGMGYFDALGLADGVASMPAHAFFAQELVRDANGVTNIDQIFDAIAAQTSTVTCQPSSATEWVEQVAEANLPVDAGLPPGTLGTILLTSQSSDAQYEAPILRDPTTGTLSFQFSEVPQGIYTLTAVGFYRGDDGVTRQYAELLANEQVVNQLTVSITGPEVDLGMLSFVFTEDVCAV